jgi:site-specific recombinase XerD
MSDTSTAVERYQPVMSEAEQTTLLGFLAGYRGYTRDAYTLDLRQFTAWCWRHQHRLFEVRRVDIECFARELEERGKARATVARRLCTIVGFYSLRRRRRRHRTLTSRAHPSPPYRLRVPCCPVGPQRAGCDPRHRRPVIAAG